MLYKKLSDALVTISDICLCILNESIKFVFSLSRSVLLFVILLFVDEC